MTPQTLTKERREKFEELIISSPLFGYACFWSNHVGDKKVPPMLRELVEKLAEASLSRSERKTDETPAEYNAEVMRGDWREYPEHLHYVAKCLRDVWMFDLPDKPKKAKEKSKYSMFVIAMEQIKQNCAEFGVKALELTHKKWRDGFKGGIAPYTIAQPTSLVNVVSATVLELRQNSVEINQSNIGI